MTCPTCRREDVPETCGSTLGKPCNCCGMEIIATAEIEIPQQSSESEEEGEQNEA